MSKLGYNLCHNCDNYYDNISTVVMGGYNMRVRLGDNNWEVKGYWHCEICKYAYREYFKRYDLLKDIPTIHDQ